MGGEVVVVSAVEERFEFGPVVADLGTSRISDAAVRATKEPVFVQVLARNDQELAALSEALDKGARALSDAGVPGRPMEWDVSTSPGWIAYDHFGEPLANAVRRGRDPSLVDSVAIETAVALEILGKVGLTHRAVNPRTLFQKNHRIALLGLDALRATYQTARADSALANDPRFTAPEAFDGGGDIKADVYSLGCIVFALLTGGPPYFGDAALLREAHRSQPIPVVPGQDAVGWNDLLRKMLAKDPGSRPQPSEIARLVGKARQRSFASIPVAAPVALPGKRKSRAPILAVLGAAVVIVALAGFGAARALAPSDPGTPAASVAPTGPAAIAPVAGTSATPAPSAAATSEPTPEPTTTARTGPVATPRRTAARTPAPTAAPISQVTPAAGPRGTLFRFAVGGLPPGAVFVQSYSDVTGFQSTPIPSGVVGQDGVARTTLATDQRMRLGPYAMRITSGGSSRVVTFQLLP